MKTAILQSKSEIDLKLLIELANKIGIKSVILTESEIEEYGLIEAIQSGRTGEFVNTDEFIHSLRK